MLSSGNGKPINSLVILTLQGYNKIKLFLHVCAACSKRFFEAYTRDSCFN